MSFAIWMSGAAFRGVVPRQYHASTEVTTTSCDSALNASGLGMRWGPAGV